MQWNGLNTVKKPRVVSESESPDSRNCLVGPYSRLRTRPGVAKSYSLAARSGIYNILNIKSDDCKNDYSIVMTGDGRVIEAPEDIWDGYTGITTCAELQAIPDSASGSYYLANDIDCTSCTQDPGGACYNGGLGFDPIVDFSGTLDGRGHTITGLKVNRPLESRMGLFQDIYSATIKNLGLIDFDITSLNGGGALAGYAYRACVITKCYSTGAVDTANVPQTHSSGGLIGRANDLNSGTGVTMTDCYSLCSVADPYQAGGLIGRTLKNATLTNCYSTGLVVSAGTGGGLVAVKGTGDIASNCFWDTETSGQASSVLGTGKTTAQMMLEATFTDWDFDIIWDITGGTSYPFLRT